MHSMQLQLCLNCFFSCLTFWSKFAFNERVLLAMTQNSVQAIEHCLLSMMPVPSRQWEQHKMPQTLLVTCWTNQMLMVRAIWLDLLGLSLSGVTIWSLKAMTKARHRSSMMFERAWMRANMWVLLALQSWGRLLNRCIVGSLSCHCPVSRMLNLNLTPGDQPLPIQGVLTDYLIGHIAAHGSEDAIDDDQITAGIAAAGETEYRAQDLSS